MDEGFPLPPFAGFRPEGLAFLRGLAANQTKVWMEANKAVYEAELRLPLASLVSDMSARFAAAGLDLRADPKRALFRLHRDVRFSKDKRPYKTHVSAAITRNGDRLAPGVFYVHIDPEGCFAGGGFYHPEPEALARLRAGMVRWPKAWAALVTGLETHGLALRREDALARPPKGYDGAARELDADLKLKSWTAMRPLNAAEIAGPGLLDVLGDLALALAPLLRFGWAALEWRE